MTDDRRIPHPPYDQLRKDVGDDPFAVSALDALQSELQAPVPERASVEQHVDVLRGIRTLEARIANWWDDPVTQTWIKSLSDAGL
jgi:hypothetical protein